MSIRLYGYWRSSATYRVRIALNLKELAYEYIPVSLKPGVSEHRRPEYRSKNPQMLVPFFEDGSIATGQSMAILEHLEEVSPKVPLLPAHEPQRSQVRAFANAIACDIQPLQNLRVMKYVKRNYDADAQDWARHWIREGLVALEALAGDGPFALGDSPSLADVFLVPQIYNARRMELPTDDFPRLMAAVDHCNTLAPFQEAAPEAQPDAF